MLFDNKVPARKFKYTKVDRKLLKPCTYDSEDDSMANAQIIEFARPNDYETKAAAAEHLEN